MCLSLSATPPVDRLIHRQTPSPLKIPPIKQLYRYTLPALIVLNEVNGIRRVSFHKFRRAKITGLWYYRGDYACPADPHVNRQGIRVYRGVCVVGDTFLDAHTQEFYGRSMWELLNVEIPGYSLAQYNRIWDADSTTGPRDIKPWSEGWRGYRGRRDKALSPTILHFCLHTYFQGYGVCRANARRYVTARHGNHNARNTGYTIWKRHLCIGIPAAKAQQVLE